MTSLFLSVTDVIILITEDDVILSITEDGVINYIYIYIYIYSVSIYTDSVYVLSYIVVRATKSLNGF